MIGSGCAGPLSTQFDGTDTIPKVVSTPATRSLSGGGALNEGWTTSNSPADGASGLLGGLLYIILALYFQCTFQKPRILYHLQTFSQSWRVWFHP